MFFPFIGLMVTLSLWSTILTLRPNDPREDYVRRLTSTIGITALITGSIDLANGITNAYASRKGSDVHTELHDIVNSGELHTTATSTVRIPSKTAKSDSDRDAGFSPLSMRARLLIVVGGVLVMVSLPRKKTVPMDDSMDENHAELDPSFYRALEISYLFSPEAEPSLYERMNLLLFSSLQLNPGSSEAVEKPSETDDSSFTSRPHSSTLSSPVASSTTTRSTTPTPSNLSTPQSTPVDYNHLPVSPTDSNSWITLYSADNNLNRHTKSGVTLPHQVELETKLNEVKTNLGGPISGTITSSPTILTSEPSSPEQDSTSTTPKKSRRPRPSQAKRRRLARQD